MSAWHVIDPELWFRGAASFSLYAYRRGTVVPISFYSDAEKTSTLEWPLTLNDDGNGNGRITAYVGESATLVLKDLSGADVDGFPTDIILPATTDITDALAEDVADLRDDNAGIHASLDSALEGISTLLADVDDLNERLTAAEGTIVTHTGQIGTLQSTSDNHGDQIGELQDTVANQGDQIGVLQDTVSNHGDQIGVLQDTVSNHGDQIGVLQDTVANHGDQIGDLQAADTALDGRLDALEAAAFDAPTGSASYFRDPTTGFTIRTGNASTGGGGTGVVTFAGVYTATPTVVATAVWGGGSEMVIIKVTDASTEAFTCAAGTVDSDGVHLQSVAYNWVAMGLS